MIDRKSGVMVLSAGAMVAGLPVLASGATLAHWRFEGSATVQAGANNDFLDDYSGSGRDLSLPASSNGTQAILPTSGNGSKFPTSLTVGGNTVTNGATAAFNGNDQRLLAADSSAWTDNTMTVEALISLSSVNTSNKSIVGHWTGTGVNRSWLLAVGTDNRLSLLASGGQIAAAGSAANALVANKDYYVGVSFDVSDTSSAGVTFYIQNLTDGGALQTFASTHTASLTTLADAATSLTIGATGTPSSPLNGLIDEVRISDARLSVDQLLVPEPGVVGVLGVAGMTALGRRRSRRR